MKLLPGVLGLALVLMTLAGSNAAVAAAQDTGTPAPLATPRIVDRGGVEGSGDVEYALESRFWNWVGWPTWFGSMMLGIFWAYRRSHTSLVRAFIAKHFPSEEENPLDRSPFVQTQSSSGGLVSGALLLALTTVFFLSQFALYNYPSNLSIPTEALDILPWLEFAPWLSTLIAPFLVGLLSASRGVWAIPVLGYVFGMGLWLATPWEDLAGLTYDLSIPGFFLMRVTVPALLMYLAYRVGRGFRRAFT